MNSKYFALLLAIVFALFAVTSDFVREWWHPLKIWQKVISFAIPATWFLWYTFYLLFKTK